MDLLDDPVIKAKLLQLKAVAAIEKSTAEAIAALNTHREEDLEYAEERIFNLRDSMLSRINEKTDRLLTESFDLDKLLNEEQAQKTNDANEANAVLRNEVQELKTENDSLKADIRASEEARLQLLEHENALNAEVKQRRDEIQAAQCKINALEAQNEKLMTTNATKEQQIAELSAELGASQEKLESSRAAMENLRAQVVSLYLPDSLKKTLIKSRSSFRW